MSLSMNPLKQGLKHDFVWFYKMYTVLSLSMNPLKQGLKLSLAMRALNYFGSLYP